jgi:phage/plasmid-like protein (TIGR03299 family)
MAHEITSTDTVGIVASTGWHGLGKVIANNLSAYEALESLGLNWSVLESESLTATFSGDPTPVDCSNERKALLRSDTRTVLGVVGKQYHPLQNLTLASLADGLAEGEGAPRVDSAGSLAGGRKVFIGLRGETTVIGGDEAFTYLVLANSHDGSGALRIHPSTTRVVCANTYAGSEADSHLGFSWRHTSGLALKRDEILNTLAQWRSRIAVAKSQADEMAAAAVNAERVRDIFVAVYEQQTGQRIDLAPRTFVEQKRTSRALAALAHMGKTFDLERQGGCKPSVWLAANAATNWIQHVSGRLDASDRTASCVVGLKAEQTARAMSCAAAFI